MLRQLLMLILLAGVGSSSLWASDSYLGVYVRMVGGMVHVEDEQIGFAPKDTVRLSISVANEEGGQELFLDGGIAGAVHVDLLFDGEPQEVAFSWNKNDQRYASSGSLPPAPSRDGVLEPGVGLTTELTLSRRDDAAFVAGHYEIRLHVDADATTFANGSPWAGRGGIAGVRFELRTEDSADERLLALKIRAGDAFRAGRYRDAADQWAEVLEFDTAGAAGWAGLGVSLFHLGDHQGVVECLEKLTPMFSGRLSHSTLPLFLAESYVALGDLEKARETLRFIVVEPQIQSKLRQLQLKVAESEMQP